MVAYNSRKNKLAYHLNKKKKPAKTESKFFYYYPCKKRDAPNVRIGDQYFIRLEVSEQEWEALIEMDRFEYNNTHKFQRHTYVFPDTDEDTLSPKAQERRIEKDTPFTDTLNEETDREKLMVKLSKTEQEVLPLCDEGISQAEIAEDLGVTQGHVATILKKANAKMIEYETAKATPDEIVWKYWEIFLNTGEMPNGLDVELEFVIREIFADSMPVLYWYYSVGELCRHIMRYYLFDEDKIEEDIAQFKRAVKDNERQYFEAHYGEKLPIIQAVFARLGLEVVRRMETGLHDSTKLYTSIYATVEKIATRLKTTVYEFLTRRFYPFFAERRNKRIRQFYKAYSGKNTPK